MVNFLRGAAMETVNIYDAKTRLSQLVDKAASGEDVFDRLLLAQAIAEPLKLLTTDAVLAQYSQMVLLV